MQPIGQEENEMTTRETYSVEIEQNSYMDDLFNGTYDECVEYIRKNDYTREENDVRIAKIAIDEDECVAETLDIITDF